MPKLPAAVLLQPRLPTQMVGVVPHSRSHAQRGFPPEKLGEGYE